MPKEKAAISSAHMDHQQQQQQHSLLLYYYTTIFCLIILAEPDYYYGLCLWPDRCETNTGRGRKRRRVAFEQDKHD